MTDTDRSSLLVVIVAALCLIVFGPALITAVFFTLGVLIALLFQFALAGVGFLLVFGLIAVVIGAVEKSHKAG